MTPRAPALVLALALVVAVLSGRFVVRTVQTARHGEARDFATLYTAAHLLRQGQPFYEPDMNNADGINRNAALVAEARRLGTLHAHEDLMHIHQVSYPPVTVLAFVPFSFLSWRQAVVAWMAVSLLLLVAAFVWIARAARLDAAAALTLAAIFLAGEPVENSMALGQINQLVLALVALFVWALASGRPVLGGVALGAATALRLHPALFIGWLAWRRKWLACGIALAVAVAGTALGAVGVGWGPTIEYATRVAPQYGYAKVSGQLGILSLSGWIVATGHGLLAPVPLAVWRVLGVVASLAALAALALVLRPGGPIAPARLVPELGLVALVLLLITPNTTVNHLVFTLVPLAVLVGATLREGAAARAAWLATALVLIGAIDDYYVHPTLTAGAGVLLAGIKTYGLAILAVLMVTVLPVRAEPVPR